MKRDIESWIDEIDLVSGCHNEKGYILTPESVKLIKQLISDYDSGLVTGKFFHKIPFVKKYSTQLITYRISQLGMKNVVGGTWEFNGEYREDYYKWVGCYVVFFHHEDGSGSDWIVGHNTNGIFASSEDIVVKFYNHFKPDFWDSLEI